ncbi:MAG: sensor histidine kinase [Planctomycetota bacterium JB042]
MSADRRAVARPPRFVASRGFRIVFIVLLVVCAAQIAYWVWDEVRYTTATRDRRAEVLVTEAMAATALREWLPADRVAPLFPRISVPETGWVSVRPEVLAALNEEARRRVNRFLWEGGFFLVVLCAGMVILNRALRQEARLRRQEENFLASVSHELKSPLASIRLSAETLADGAPDPERRGRLAGRLLDDVQRLETMVSNLLDAGRVEERGASRAREPVALSDAVRGVLAELAPQLEARGATVRTELDERASIVADPEGVRAVVRNLLDNARKAIARTPDGSIDVRVASESGRVSLVVRDDGVGFSPEEGRRLFEKFYRPGDELRRSGSGSGLGLYLVRRHVEREGGSVRAASDGDGEGAEFRVEWPAAAAEEGA